MKSGNYDKAIECFRKAIAMSEGLPFCLTAESTVLLADMEYVKDNNDNALRLIRHLPDSVDSLSHNYALTTAAYIYRKAGIYDTASYLAQKIVESPDHNNRHIGYYLLLQPEMRSYIDQDSLDSYINSYITAAENYYNTNQSNLGIIQQAIFNYSLHERDKAIAVEENASLKVRLLVYVTIISILVILFLISVIRKKNSSLHLWRKIDVIGYLKRLYFSSESVSEGESDPTRIGASPQDRFNRDLKELLSRNMPEIEIAIIQSEVFKTLQRLLKDGKFIKEDGDEFNQLEALILSVSKDFKENLQLLTQNKLRDGDFELALLIRCGFTTSQISQLIQRTTSAISSRKSSLSTKIFGGKGHTKDLDKLIRLL